MRRASCRTSWLTALCVAASSQWPSSAFAQGEPEPDEAEVPEEKPAAPAAEPAPAPAESSPKDDSEAPADEVDASDKPTGDKKPADDAAQDEADMAEADMAELEGVDIGKPPAKGKGAIVGVITDTKFEEAIIEGRVQIVGQKFETYTDEEGRFRVELPPGTYSLRVSYELHQPTRVDGIKVVAGKLVRIDAKLTPDENAIEEVPVIEEADKTSLEGQTLQRQRTASVGDGVGRAEIARTPDRSAAEAAQRVVGATIVGSRFVYVRGLGERYTNALLNGAPLPSPEPDRQTVPLDLFPTLVLDSITITKQFTPDLPADFAGGSVRIYTREFPRQTLFQVSLNGSYNTETTFREGLGTHGSSTDFLGFDDGVRDKPEGLPNKLLVDTNADENERALWAKRMNSYMSAVRRTMPPNHGISVVAGDSFKTGNEQKLGLVGALSYSHGYQRRLISDRKFVVEQDASGKWLPRVNEFSNGEIGIDSVRWGAFATGAYEFSRSHKLTLTGLRSQSSDDTAAELEGFDDSASAILRSVHTEYVSRALNVVQLRGFHQFSVLNQAEIDWYGSFSTASRDQPDTRDTLYRRSATGAPLAYQWISGADSGAHFYSEQSEQSVGGGLDYTQPVIKAGDTKLKLGTMVTFREREFTARRFVLEPAMGRGVPPQPQSFTDSQICSGAWRSECPDKFFRPENISPTLLLLRENTQPYDGYTANLDVLAGYGMLDIEPVKTLRVIGGARIEATDQSFEAFSPLDPDARTAESSIDSNDILPAVSVIYATTSKSNTRFGLSRTLARPQLREISPFFSSGYTLDLPVQGNADLKLTKITNADLRFEHFPTLREVLAFSFFYKHFVDPIEEVIHKSSTGSVLTYDNAPAADLIGLELEARKALEFLTPSLKNFMLIGNLTLARSRVDFGGNRGIATNASRPLSFQSPYIVNVSLDYANPDSGTDVRLLYNVYGERITTVGANHLPDTYEEPRHVVDLTAAQNLGKHFEAKVSALNIFSSDVVYRYLGAREYVRDQGVLRPGDKDPVVRKYSPGTTLTLTLSYTY